MEAAALAAKQTLDLGNSRAQEISVSFPFPQIFQNARDAAHKFLENKRHA